MALFSQSMELPTFDGDEEGIPLKNMESTISFKL